MSQRLDKLLLGDTMQFKGPKGRYTYQKGSLTDIGAWRDASGRNAFEETVYSAVGSPKQDCLHTCLPTLWSSGASFCQMHASIAVSMPRQQ